MKAAAAAEGSASCNHRALERLLAGALAERQGPGAVGLPQQSGDRMHSASRRLQERRARQQHRRFSVSSESDDESLGGGGATHETRPMPGFDWRQQLEQRQQMEQLEQRQKLSPMRRELPPPPPQHLEGPSVMEVVNMSIQELEAKAQQVEARAAQLASRAERPAEGDGRAGRGRPPAYERAAEGGGYAVDTAAESSDWELARLAQELPVVEARRAQHIGKLATRIDSALRHVDGLSTHLDDLASRPAPPPLPSTRAQSVRVDTAEPPQAGTGPISKAEQLLARLQDDERGDALEEGFEELSRAENIQTALVARLAAATNPSLRTELQLALAETTSTIADLRQQVRTLAAQTPAARETPSPSLQSDAGRATETGDFVIVGPTDQGPATLRRAPRPLLPPQRTSTIPDEMNRLPVSTPLVARTTAHPYAPQPGSPQQQEQVLKQAFRAMDTNHDGVISREEFTQGLKVPAHVRSDRAEAEAEAGRRRAAEEAERKETARQQAASGSPRHRPEAEALSELGLSLEPEEVSMFVLRAALQAYRNGPCETIGEAVSAVDKRDSGYLDDKEFAQCAARMGMVMSNSDVVETMREIDMDKDGLVSREDVEAWWEDRILPPKAVFTADEERERRETHRVIERKFKAREADLQRRVSDAERQVKVEVAKRAQLEQQYHASQEFADESAEHRRLLEQAQQELAETRTELDRQRQLAGPSAEDRRALAEAQHELITTRAELDAQRQMAAQMAAQSTEDRRLLAEAQQELCTTRAELDALRQSADESAEHRRLLEQAQQELAETRTELDRQRQLAGPSAEDRRALAEAQHELITTRAELDAQRQMAAQMAAQSTEDRRLLAEAQQELDALRQQVIRDPELETQLEAAEDRADAAEAAAAAAREEQRASSRALSAAMAELESSAATIAELESRAEQAEEMVASAEETSKAQRAELRRLQHAAQLHSAEVAALEVQLQEANERLAAANANERKLRQSAVDQVQAVTETAEREAMEMQQRHKARLKEETDRQGELVVELEATKAMVEEAQRERDAERAKLSRAEKKHTSAMAAQQTDFQDALQLSEDKLQRQKAQLENTLRLTENRCSEATERANYHEQQAETAQRKSDSNEQLLAASKRDLAASQTRVHETELKLTTAESDLQRHKMLLLEQEQFVQALQKEAQTAKDEAERLRDLFGKEQSAQVQELEAALHQAGERAVGAEADASTQQLEVKRLKDMLAATKDALGESERQSHATESGLRAEIEQQKTQLEDKDSTVRLAEGRLREASDAMADMEAEYKQQLLQQTELAADAKRREETARDELSRLRDRNGLEQDEQVRNLEDSLRAAELRTDQVERAAGVANREKKMLASKMEAKQRELDEAMEDHQAAETALRAQIADLKRTIDQLGREDRKVQIRKETLHSKIDDLAEGDDLASPPSARELTHQLDTLATRDPRLQELVTKSKPEPDDSTSDFDSAAEDSGDELPSPPPSDPPVPQPAANFQKISISIEKSPKGFGLEISENGHVVKCTPGSISEAHGVPWPSRIVEVNHIPVSTKEDVRVALGDAPDPVPFMFLYDASKVSPEPSSTHWTAPNIQIGLEFSNECARNSFRSIDKDGTGSISHAELNELAQRMEAKGHNPKPLLSILKLLDTDGSGEIEFEEWQHLWSRLDSFCSEKVRVSHRENVCFALTFLALVLSVELTLPIAVYRHK